ncbi:hypothetical protein FRC09_014243 [Ceratobasidium sp. 395]|nr:hypothetical protein FRC09_014243 [Ceratobasidium sp. 395]
MIERARRRIHRVEQKLDRLFGGGEPTNSIGQAPAASSPRPAQIGHTARAGIRSLLDVLSVSAGEFGPLKSAIGGLLRCIEIHENQVAPHEEYHRLKIDLDNVCQEIVGYVGEAAPPSMQSSIAKLAEWVLRRQPEPRLISYRRGIQEEINLIDQKTGRSTLGRYAEAIDDTDRILDRYRRIQKHLDAFALSAGMKVWQIVDDQATRSRLKELPNSPEAKYCSTESRSVGRNECTPGTRVEVIKQLRDWARDSESRKIYWLNGMAGTGKTTIAYSLCSQLEREG